MSKQLINTAFAMASVIRAEMKNQPGKGVGMNIGSYWMTPEECWNVRTGIMEANNQAYGVDKWTTDMDVVDYLFFRAYQNEADFNKF